MGLTGKSKKSDSYRLSAINEFVDNHF